MGRPRKNPLPTETETPSGAAEAVETKKPDPVETFRAALNDLINSDPKVAAKVMADVLGVAEGKMRTVEPERRPKIEIPKVETPNLPPPPPPKPGVVFASKHLGFRLVLEKGGARYDALGNKEILPPRLLDFSDGMARVTEAKDIASVRAFIAKQRALVADKEPAVVEIRDEIAAEAEAGRKVTAIASQRVTAATSLAELVTA